MLCEQCGQGHTERPAARLNDLQLSSLRQSQAAGNYMQAASQAVMGPAGLRVPGSRARLTSCSKGSIAVGACCAWHLHVCGKRQQAWMPELIQHKATFGGC